MCIYWPFHLKVSKARRKLDGKEPTAEDSDWVFVSSPTGVLSSGSNELLNSQSRTENSSSRRVELEAQSIPMRQLLSDDEDRIEVSERRDRGMGEKQSGKAAKTLVTEGPSKTYARGGNLWRPASSFLPMASVLSNRRIDHDNVVYD